MARTIHSVAVPVSVQKEIRLVYGNGHCHAPACLSSTLYRLVPTDDDPTGYDKRELICHQTPVLSTGAVERDRFDELGYHALPPCVWHGRTKDPQEGQKEGLRLAPVFEDGTPMLGVKVNRNTLVGHFGEMASWQMRAVIGDEEL